MADIIVAAMEQAHWPAVRAIYAAGIATGNATFEIEPPSWQNWDANHLSEHRMVALDDGHVRGWSAVSPVSARTAYAGVVESTVYVRPEQMGRGVGLALLSALVASTEADGIWTIQANIMRENAVSRALHEKVGFRTVGVRERIGQHHGRWRDVVLLERRSAVVG